MTEKTTVHIDTINRMKTNHIERGHSAASAYRMAIRELNRKYNDGFTIAIENTGRDIKPIDISDVPKDAASDD